MSLPEEAEPWEVLSQGTLDALEAAAAGDTRLADPRAPVDEVRALRQQGVLLPSYPPWAKVTVEARGPFSMALLGCADGLSAARDVLSRAGTASQPQPVADGLPSASSELLLPLAQYEHVRSRLEAAGVLSRTRSATIPVSTLAALRRVARERTSGTREHAAACERAAEAEALLQRLPPVLARTLLPFQRDGIRAALSLGGRLLLADEMGTGKTLQACGFAACVAHEGPLLVVCPASLREQWADALETWLSFLGPTSVSVVCDSKDKGLLDDLARCAVRPPLCGGEAAWPPPQARPPPGAPPPRGHRCVVTSFRMLEALRAVAESIAWGALVVDESHVVRCSNAPQDSKQTEAVASLVARTRRALLLSGTPALNRPFDLYRQVDALRPGLLGPNKYAFGDAYCERRPPVPGAFGSGSCGGGVRLPELHALLSACVMLRRLKRDVADQLPPLRRRVVRLTHDDEAADEALRAADARAADEAAAAAALKAARRRGGCGDGAGDDGGAPAPRPPSRSAAHVTGIRKVPSAAAWLLRGLLRPGGLRKAVVFAHHVHVMDALQAHLCEALAPDAAPPGDAPAPCDAQYIRLDGCTPPCVRLSRVRSFHDDPRLRVALVSLTAGGTGLDLSVAQAVVFVELPQDAGTAAQCEARAHRRGRDAAAPCLDVVYLTTRGCAEEEARWAGLAARLERVRLLAGDAPLTHAPTGRAEAAMEVHHFTDAGGAGGDAGAEEKEEEGAPTFPPTQAAVEAEFAAEAALAQAEAERVEAAEAAAAEAAAVASQAEEEAARIAAYDPLSPPPDSCDALPADALLFQLSSVTGRVHAFASAGEEEVDCGRPIAHLCSFPPADLDAHARSPCLPVPLCSNAAARRCARDFVAAMACLRPLHRSRLSAGPLARPLRADDVPSAAAEAACAGASAPSVLRIAKHVDDLAPPPPPGAVERYVLLRHAPPLPRETRRTQWHCPRVGWLCVACRRAPARVQHPLHPSPPLVANGLLDLCCSVTCCERVRRARRAPLSHGFQLTRARQYAFASDPGALRRALFALEKGVCTACGLDCGALSERLRGLKGAAQAPTHRRVLLSAAPRFRLPAHAGRLRQLLATCHAGALWQADHITPVCEGGGLCGLENMRTLCVICHDEQTAAGAGRGAARRKAAALMDDSPEGKKTHQITLNGCVRILRLPACRCLLTV